MAFKGLKEFVICYGSIERSHIRMKGHSYLSMPFHHGACAQKCTFTSSSSVFVKERESG